MDIIYIPLGWVIRLINNLVGNQYLVALFLFAVFIELILIPFGIKQQKNSIKQASLRPKEMAIRKKYAGRDDNVTKQKVNQEIQELYQREGYSPFSGCLPLLIQMPIMFALYYIVTNPLKYICQLSEATIEQLHKVVTSFGSNISIENGRTIALMSEIEKISASNPGAFANVEGFNPDIVFPKMNLLGIDFAETPSFSSFNWLWLIPILTFLAYFFSAKITRKLTYQPTAANEAGAGCSTSMMDWMMPLMSVFISFAVPAAVGVYWIYRSILGVVKQFILKKAMPLPVFTEEDYKAAEKEYGAKPEKATRTRSSGTKSGVRSLHHIDDEDFPDTAPAALERKRAQEEAEKNANDDEEEVKPSLITPAPIKEDDRPKKKGKTEEKVTEEEAPASDKSNDNENN